MTHIIVIICRTPHFVFYSIDLQLKQISLPNFACFFFTVKLPRVTQRSVSQENAFKMSTNPSPFFRKQYAQTILDSNKVFKIAKVEFKVTKHYGLSWQMAPSCEPLMALSNTSTQYPGEICMNLFAF